MADRGFHLETTLLPTGRKADLWVRGGEYVAGPLDVPTLHRGGYAFSGLVDAHAHLAIASPLEDGNEVDTVRASARQHLDAGVLAIREPGSPNRASRSVGGGDGLPTVITAGRFLAPPGGYLPGLPREVGVDRLPDVAVEELRQSGGWVKVIGDFLDDGDWFAPNYTTEALTEAAARVHAEGGRITMHAMVPNTIQQAIDAGFDGIEHGSVIEEGQVEAMAAAGVAWTPTALIDDIIRDSEAMMGPIRTETLTARMASHGEQIRRAHELGVQILAGTDAGMNPHGVVAREIRLLESFGIPAQAALGAGSWEAREYLGLPGVEIGAPADLVIFPDDPRGDLAVLDHPSWIVLGGEVIRGAEDLV